MLVVALEEINVALVRSVLMMLDQSFVVFSIYNLVWVVWLQRPGAFVADQTASSMTVLLLTFVLGGTTIRLIYVESHVRFNLSSVSIEHGRLGRIGKTRVIALLSRKVSSAGCWLNIVTRVNHHVIAGIRGQTPILIKLNAFLWSILRLTIGI